MGSHLFFGALIVHWALDFFEFDRAGSIPMEFGLHVGRRVIDAARRGNGSFLAIPVMARKGFGIPPTVVGGLFKSFLQDNPKATFNPAHGSGRIFQVATIHQKHTNS